MHFEDWDYDRENKAVNDYLMKFDNDLDKLFTTSNPQDLDEIIKSVMKKNTPKRKKHKAPKETNRITDLMVKYDLPCLYVVEEFIIDDCIIDPHPD